jgi:FAD/FMN-containing dehydrogenase
MESETKLDLGELGSRVDGTVHAPGEDGWDEARTAWNLVVDQHPAAVVAVATAQDISAVIAFARTNGLKVTAQGTGHGAGALGPIDGTILIKTGRLNRVEIDAANRIGRFGAGVIWRDAGDAAGEHGLAVLAGSSPDVGVAGYTTGGGVGWLGRRYGLACNSVRAIDLVTADGEPRRVDADSEPELFWALRGGGGSFGVVTAMEFDLVKLPQVFAGSVIYPADERSGEILQRYREWASTVPDEIGSIARFLHLPPLPQVPEPLRDRPLITLSACFAGPESDGAGLIAPLRRLGEPVVDRFAAMPPAGLVTVHMDPEEPVPALVHSASLRELSEPAVDAFVAAAGPDSGSPLLAAQLNQAGGALARAPQGAGALSHIEEASVVGCIGVPMGPESAAAITRHTDAVLDALKPWSSDRRYLNFADRPVAPEALFGAETLDRLRAVKRRYDPDGLIRATHGVVA